MRDAMKAGMTVCALLLLSSAVTYGQAKSTGSSAATPTAITSSNVGFTLPSVDGTIHYALTASEIVQYGYFGSGRATASTALSGNASYSSTSVDLPFNLLYAGGVLISESSGVNTTTYQNLAVSQGLIAKRWVLGITDSLSYLPQSPTTGLSGIQGVGDIGGYPVQGPSAGPAGGVLSYYGSRVSNGLSGSVERLLTGKTSISGSGSWSVLHFLHGNDGYNSSQVSGQAGLNHRLDARDSMSVNGIYSIYNFGANLGGVSFTTRGVNGVYSRVLSRSLTMNLSAGPQWISSSNSALIPSSLNVAANAGLSYVYKLTTASLGYSRGVNAGSGVQVGGLSDTVSGSLGHSYGREWQASASGAYSHTTGLVKGTLTPPPGAVYPLGGDFTTVYGAVQVSHRLSRSLSMYASAGVQHQSHDAGFIGNNAFTGTSQTFGIGITFAPRSTRLGQF